MTELYGDEHNAVKPSKMRNGEEARRLILVRHAESEGSVGRCIGHTDLDISSSAQALLSSFQNSEGAFYTELAKALGSRAAATDNTAQETDIPFDALSKELPEALSEALSTDEIDEIALYSSDLVRAQKTASAIAARFGLTLTLDRCFREIDFGDWDGRTWQELTSVDNVALEKWMADWIHYTPPNGESLIDLTVRVQNALNRLANSKATISVIVTHAGWIRAALCKLNNLPVSEMFSFSVGYLSVTVIDW